MVGGRHQFFPERKLNTITYNIEDAYQGLYQQIRCYLGKSRKGLPAEPLPDALGLLYHQHNMSEALDRQRAGHKERPLPKIVCGEALL